MFFFYGRRLHRTFLFRQVDETMAIAADKEEKEEDAKGDFEMEWEREEGFGGTLRSRNSNFERRKMSMMKCVGGTSGSTSISSGPFKTKNSHRPRHHPSFDHLTYCGAFSNL